MCNSPPIGSSPTLADAGGPLAIALWIMLAASLAIAGAYLALAIKRWTQRDEPAETFTLQDLRDMRARDQITDREFDTLRAELLGRAGAAHPTESDADKPGS
jgi:hypothetical protein